MTLNAEPLTADWRFPNCPAGITGRIENKRVGEYVISLLNFYWYIIIIAQYSEMWVYECKIEESILYYLDSVPRMDLKKT